MTKEQVKQKINEIIAKYPQYKDAVIKVKFKEKKGIHYYDPSKNTPQ